MLVGSAEAVPSTESSVGAGGVACLAFGTSARDAASRTSKVTTSPAATVHPRERRRVGREGLVAPETVGLETWVCTRGSALGDDTSDRSVAGGGELRCAGEVE
jgi:hypothetical protein